MLQLASPIPSQVIVPGSTFTISIHVHDTDGNNFNWSGYVPKMTVTVGSVSFTATGTVISQAGGTASFLIASSVTLTLPNNAWGMLVLFADPVDTNNRHIATILCRTTSEEI